MKTAPRSEPPEFVTSLRTVQAAWQLPLEQFASICHVDADRLQGWFDGSESSAGSIPAGGQGASAVISIHRCLSEKLAEPSKQVEWLTTAHPDFEGQRPFDVIRASAAHAAWVAYFLESARGRPDGA